MFISPRAAARRLVHLPSAPIPQGRILELPGRDGATFVTDTAGPHPGSATILLLHAVGTTGLLTWYPAIPELAAHYRVVTLDQRRHGRGIQSDSFSLRDCADDAAALIDVLALKRVVAAGYSLGSIVAQRLWLQHPERVSGLVLCATTDLFRSTLTERVFHEAMEWSMAGLRGTAARAAGHALDLRPSDIHDWALAEFRSTSPWAVGQAVAALGRHHSRPWLNRIDVPTAVVATRRNRVIPLERQLDLARRIPGATIHDIEAGHASCVLEAEVFVPALVEACATVTARMRQPPSAPKAPQGSAARGPRDRASAHDRR